MYKERLRYRREELEIKQQDIAKYLGINNTTYCHYENESDIIPIKHLIKVCDYLDISLDYVFGFTKNTTYFNYKKGIDKNKIGLRLKEFRNDKKLYQEDLAKELNTTNTVISDYEVGRYIIATPFLYTICKKYNVSVDWLLGRIDNPKFR